MLHEPFKSENGECIRRNNIPTDIILLKTATDHSQQHNETATDLFVKRSTLT